MPRHSRTRQDLLRSSRPERGGLLYDEQVSLVCRYFSRGDTPSDIRRILESDHGITLKREEPWQMIGYAAAKGWIRFVAPYERELEEMIRERYGGLSVTVARTGATEDVSFHVARTLLDLVRARVVQSTAEEVHIGFAGGSSLRAAARILADLLCQPPFDHLPKRLVFHAMVAGFNVQDPRPDPNAFFTYLASGAELPIETRFVALLAPGIVQTRMMGDLKRIPDIREAYDRASEIDIIVTSAGGHWQEGHSALYDLYQRRSRPSLDALNAAGCIGDMMWRPIGAGGPIEVETEVRAMTLMELADLPAFLRQGKQVVLLMGPCGECRGPKSEVLRAILNQPKRMVSHVVVDSRSARGLFT